jgi:hypothetical protein
MVHGDQIRPGWGREMLQILGQWIKGRLSDRPCGRVNFGSLRFPGTTPTLAPFEESGV